MAGREHDYPEQFAAGLEPHTVQDKYYYARRPEITRVVDVSGVVDQIIDANRANRAKGPAGTHGSQLKAELARRGQKLPLLGRRRRRPPTATTSSSSSSTRRRDPRREIRRRNTPKPSTTSAPATPAPPPWKNTSTTTPFRSSSRHTPCAVTIASALDLSDRALSDFS